MEIYRVGNANKKRVWEVFRKHHYLNTSLNNAAEQWVGTINGELVCHIGIIQFPMRKGWKRVHRLVVIPDYQGIGIGTSFQDDIVKRYKDNGLNVNCTTTTPALVGALRRSKRWALFRAGRCKSTWASFKKTNTYVRGRGKEMELLAKTNSSNRVTYSFNFIK